VIQQLLKNLSMKIFFGKNILKIIWQIQQEFDVPMGAIKNNQKLANLLYLYNFGVDLNQDDLRFKIIKEIDESLNFT